MSISTETQCRIIRGNEWWMKEGKYLHGRGKTKGRAEQHRKKYATVNKARDETDDDDDDT